MGCLDHVPCDGTRKGGPRRRPSSPAASGDHLRVLHCVRGDDRRVTIPLMKRSGYSPEFSGGVEASASSGGQILPPVMGAAAFLTSVTATPFADVIVVATIPAIVFFFGVWVMVHFEAVRRTRRSDSSEPDNRGSPRPKAGGSSRRDHLLGLVFVLRLADDCLLPLGVVYAHRNRSAHRTCGGLRRRIACPPRSDSRRAVRRSRSFLFGAGVLGALAGDGTGSQSLIDAFSATVGNIGTRLSSRRSHSDRPGPDSTRHCCRSTELHDTADSTADAVGRPLRPRRAVQLGVFVGKSMESGARTAVPVVIAVAAAGIIPGVISVSGLGPNLVSLVTAVAGGSLVALLLVTALSSIILGMGMPTTVTYIILVSLLAPALTEFGVPLLAAHLFILYVGVIADITPPVAVAAYAASGVAKSDAFETGIEAFSLALAGSGAVRVHCHAGHHPDPACPDGLRYRIVGTADLLDLGYSIPEILIPLSASSSASSRWPRRLSGSRTHRSPVASGRRSRSVRCS